MNLENIKDAFNPIEMYKDYGRREEFLKNKKILKDGLEATKNDLEAREEFLKEFDLMIYTTDINTAKSNPFAQGGMAGTKTYHQYHDQYVPMDEESMMYANGGGVGSMMVPTKNFVMQGDKKPARNYLGNQQTVNKIPVKWQSGPNTPPTELAYITNAEKDLILKQDLHGSLKNGPNTGPDGIMSLDSQGDYSPDRSPSGRGGRSRQGQAQHNAHMKSILTGQRNIGQTSKVSDRTRRGAVPEYVNTPGGMKYVGSAYKSYGQPGFFGNLFGGANPGYRYYEKRQLC